MNDPIRLDDIRSIPDMTVGANGTTARTDPWQRIDLTADHLRTPPEPPAVHGLLYHAKRHVMSGPPESAKTLIAYKLLLEAQREGHGVAIIDLEMGPHAAVTMLRDLGATDDELAQILYFEPNEKPYPDLAQHLTIHAIRFVLIDAAAGAFDISGLDDNSRKDAETWARAWIQPLFQAGIATIVLDHVTKNADTRGKFTIGSERKTGGADVHLGLEALKTLSRGGTGLVKVTAHKDRGAYMQRPTVAMAELASDTDTHAVTITIKPPEIVTTDEGRFRHTIYMERVSRTLENAGTPLSRTKVEENTDGGAQYIRQGIDELVEDGYATIETGARNAQIVTLVRAFREAEYTPPRHPVTTPSRPRHDGDNDDPVTPSPPLKGDGDADGVSHADLTDSVSDGVKDYIDVYDPTIQHLLDQPDF